jgi:tetratricopeptide (TPR) repeat protein
MRIFLTTVFLALCVFSPANLPAQDKPDDRVPDKTVVRKQIDDLIAGAPNHRANLGTLHGAIALSISFGAPAWNSDDHEACAAFYIKTGQSLCSTFSGADSATPAARKILDDMKAALDRVGKSNDVDANAWTMRFVFDKNDAEVLTQVDRATRMLALGLETMNRSQYAEATNAFTAAGDSLHELDGPMLEDIPPAARYVPLALSDAEFSQKHFKLAAAAARDGLHFLPNLPDEKLDLGKHFADPEVYRLLADDLRDAATANPKDAGLQFLQGYHLFFTDHRDDAKSFFEKALELDPNDTAAKTMLESYDPNHKKAAPAGPLPPAEQA